MKRTVILCLSVLISSLLFVSCDDEGTLNTSDDGNSYADNDAGLSDDETTGAELDTNEKELVGDGDESTGGEILKDNQKQSLKCFGNQILSSHPSQNQ